MNTHKFKLLRAFTPEYDVLEIEEMEMEMSQQMYDSLSRIGTLVEQEGWHEVSILTDNIIEHEDFRADVVLFKIYGSAPSSWVYYFQSKWDAHNQYEYIMEEIL
jgi:hypothetical protein